MAEQVQSILERMVPPLKDLRDRGLFSPAEITAIVERRRRSEYSLQRRSGSRLSDYLRYIEEEVLLERLRKLRKEKVLRERRWVADGRRRGKRGRGGATADEEDEEGEGGQGRNDRKHAYKTSGIGDSHILSHIHFLYQRTLRKFGHPLDVLLNYAQFSKEHKSFKQLGRVYAEGLQRHPREAGLWIEAASFEYFGHVADDHEDGEEVNSKVVGSSIRNARVLMQRGLRVNGASQDLWLQYFALELHYVQKLRGRREILEEGAPASSSSFAEEEGIRDDKEEAQPKGSMPSALLPSQIIYKNAIRAVPDDVRFRLRFVEACRSFPRTERLQEHVMDTVARDFGTSVEGWVARILQSEEEWRRETSDQGSGGEGASGFLGRADEGSEDDGDSEDCRPAKQARVESESKTSTNDPALALLGEALETLPTPKMYLEGSRFLCLRIRRILGDGVGVGGEDEDDATYLIGEGEDAEGAAQRHSQLLEELYEAAREKGIYSTKLTLDQVDFLLSAGRLMQAEELLSNAVAAPVEASDARLWLRWSEISQLVTEAGAASEATAPRPSSSPTRILRRALERTPIHDRWSRTTISTELMRHLMMQRRSSKIEGELKSLFQELILLSQGSNYYIRNAKKRKLANGDNDDHDEEETEEHDMSLAPTFVAYLKYTLQNDDDHGGVKFAPDKDDVVRSVYASVLYHSNYGKSSSGKTEEEALDMKSFFDVCIRFEKGKRRSKGKVARKEGGARLRKLYEAAMRFFASGEGRWRKMADGYQRDLDDLKYGF